MNAIGLELLKAALLLVKRRWDGMGWDGWVGLGWVGSEERSARVRKVAAQNLTGNKGQQTNPFLL